MTLVGRTLGRYNVVEELRRGKHAVVYWAWQPSLERNVALKVLQSHDQKTLEKIQAEARLTAYLIQKFVPDVRRGPGWAHCRSRIKGSRAVGVWSLTGRSKEV